MLEQYIKGREIQVAVLEDKALPSIEIIPQAGLLRLREQVPARRGQEVCPAQIPAEWEEQAGPGGADCVPGHGLSVYARADFIVTPDGTP